MTTDETVTVTVPVGLAEQLTRNAAPLLGRPPDDLTEALLAHTALSDPDTLARIRSDAGMVAAVAGGIAGLLWAVTGVVIGNGKPESDDPHGAVCWTADVAGADPPRRLLGVAPVVDVRRLLMALGVGLAPRSGGAPELN